MTAIHLREAFTARVTWAVILTVPIVMGMSRAWAQTDPGIRTGAPAAGAVVSGASSNESKFFSAGKDAFSEVQTADGAGGTEAGLGPRFNLNSCAGCHAFPAVGGASPAANPQVSVGPASQVNLLTSLGIISASGPVREVRFKSDGGVHDLFTIVGVPGGPSNCSILQPDFSGHLSSKDVVFRIPTPTFGSGLIEAIPDSTILAAAAIPKPFGIRGHVNRNGNDGTVTRFGWKAQNKSLVIFSGEAYNVEQGVTNEVFPDDRGEAGNPDPPGCRTQGNDQDHTNFDSGSPENTPSDVVGFSNFMRFLAPPQPAIAGYTGSNRNVSVGSASIANGLAVFTAVGCIACHLAAMPTGRHSSPALSNKVAALFSDLLVHNMGSLGDGISQGSAGPNEFRTAPLWGLGQRIFLLHDGRTKDLMEAIQAHANGGSDSSSEAQQVIQRFNARGRQDQQDVLNFLRSL